MVQRVQNLACWDRDGRFLGVERTRAVQAAREGGCTLILVGKEPEIRAELAKYPTEGLPIVVHHASEVIEMHESPSKASQRAHWMTPS
jgi:glycerol-3-phosphate acyltransferase PlsX